MHCELTDRISKAIRVDSYDELKDIITDTLTYTTMVPLEEAAQLDKFDPLTSLRQLREFHHGLNKEA